MIRPFKRIVFCNLLKYFVEILFRFSIQYNKWIEHLCLLYWKPKSVFIKVVESKIGINIVLYNVE